jgi:hypothetical protein
MIGSFTLASFHAASDGSGGTLITDPPSAPTAGPPGHDNVDSVTLVDVGTSPLHFDASHLQLA